MILEGCIGLLLVMLILLGFHCQKLLMRCTIAEEKIKNQQDLKDTFQLLSQEALDKTNHSFLELAKDDLGKKQQAISDIVTKLEGNMRLLEQERKVDHGAIRQQLRTLFDTEQQLRLETSNLAKALRSPVARGRWGEIQLKRVVELSGMLNHCDFFEQQSETFDDIRFRPDLIVRLPGGRQVVVDSKVPLEAYLDALQCENDVMRLGKLKEHARHIRLHVQGLSKKAYWESFQPSPEFVILFLPSDTIFSAALEHDPSLIEVGVGHNVILATPTTLIALLRTVSYGWKQENLSMHAEKVSQMGHELYKRLADLTGHWSRMGKSLGNAVESYNKATGSLESRVMVTARKFKEMGAASSAIELIESNQIESLPRNIEFIDKPQESE
jgi:DNA recombination protein RmuC